jgi:aspartyl-tRNA(Asn)/glutamyl-tRNA(Gln) amidotransferase subunit B
MTEAWAERYEMVVGLEVHVRLATRTKIFCNCPATFGAAPNSHTCPVCLGLPGTLPVLNYEAVHLATRAALALGCDVSRVSVFARKNYFYPDLPKGYQITQSDSPLATHGKVQIGETPDGAPLNVAVQRVHLEEDAGKMLHDRFDGATAVDLNRAGVPLIEIVSGPGMRSSAEAVAYLRSLKQVVEYVGASDASMEEGSLRVDANISVRERGDTSLGTKTEIKNMNSFAAVERALEAEFARQCAIIAAGRRVQQQTMLWDAARNETRVARAKEGSDDYRFFPEPDLPPLILTKEWIDARREELPELPAAHRARLKEAYGLGPAEVAALASDRGVSAYFENVARTHGDAKAAAHWVMRDVQAVLNETKASIEEFRLQVRPADLAALLDLVRDGDVSHTAATQIFVLMVRTGDEPRRIAEREGLLQVTDDGQLGAWIDAVLAEHPAEAERYLAGDRKLQGPLVGHVMTKSGGSANPRRVNELLERRVRKR